MRWLSGQIDEIRSERAPTLYSSALALDFDLAKNACGSLPPGAADLDLSFRSKHAPEPSYYQVIRIAASWSAAPHYTTVRHNAWNEPVQQEADAWRP